MKTLINLTAAPDPAAPATMPPHPVRSTVMHNPARGIYRHVTLGDQGLTVTRRAVSVFIPIAEILKLADTHEPALMAVPAAPTPAPPK